MRPVKILVVEDEAIIADSICDALEEYGYDVLEPVMSYSEAIETIESEQPEIAILDIQLAGSKSGIDLGAEIYKKYNFPFIFLTSNSDKITLTEAKKVEPFAFLVKPFSKEELNASLEIAIFNYAKRQGAKEESENSLLVDSLFVKKKGCFHRLNFSDILFIKSDSVYLDIVTVDGKKHTVRATMNDYLDKLSENFYRIHRSYIINLEYLESVEEISVIVLGESFPIGSRYKSELINKLNRG